MFLIGHAAIGASLVSLAGIQNPAVAFAVGWASHYLGDLVPHGDETVGEWTEGHGGTGKLSALVFADLGIIAVALALLATSDRLTWSLVAVIAGSVLPDFLWGLEKLFGGKTPGRLTVFHSRVHNYFQVRLPLFVGLLFQAALSIWLWRWLIVR